MIEFEYANYMTRLRLAGVDEEEIEIIHDIILIISRQQKVSPTRLLEQTVEYYEELARKLAYRAESHIILQYLSEHGVGVVVE